MADEPDTPPAANHLFLELEARGLTFRVDGERFHVEPRERLTEGDVARIRANRAGLWSIITGQPMPPPPPPLAWFWVVWDGGKVCRLERAE